MCLDPVCAQYPVFASSTQHCGKAHNLMELEFHPLNYWASKCPKPYGCERLYCPHYHEKQLERLGPGGLFFRFDLNTFKTGSCICECT